MKLNELKFLKGTTQLSKRQMLKVNGMSIDDCGGTIPPNFDHDPPVGWEELYYDCEEIRFYC